MAQQELEEQRQRSTRSPWRVVAALGGGLVALAGGVTAVRAVSDHPNDIDRPRAVRFVQDYAKNAHSDPAWTWKHMLSDDYRLMNGNQADYIEWWSNHSVPVTSIHVTPIEEHPNKYAVSWTWMPDSSAENMRWELTCINPIEKYLPFLECSQENLRLNDSSS